MDPFLTFNDWYAEELRLSKVRIPSACCFSTVGLDGYPNARFVSLKDIHENNFVVAGTVTSLKGAEINKSNKVALTFWWTATERQVRVQGNATLMPADLTDKYFSERDRDSQLVSIVSDQGKELKDDEDLLKKYEDLSESFKGKTLLRPSNWSGYLIEPLRIEFLKFKATRFHDRKLYERSNGSWSMKKLQP